MAATKAGEASLNLTEAASKAAENQTMAEGFNQGLHLAAQKFELLVILLCLVYFGKIILEPRRVREFIRESKVDAAVFSLDVLGFVLTLILLYSLFGLPLASQY
jgi:hypothetical protein